MLCRCSTTGVGDQELPRSRGPPAAWGAPHPSARAGDLSAGLDPGHHAHTVGHAEARPTRGRLPGHPRPDGPLTWWRTPFDRLDGSCKPSAFDVEGPAPQAYTVFAVALMPIAGTGQRSTVPAMGISLVDFLASGRSEGSPAKKRTNWNWKKTIGSGWPRTMTEPVSWPCRARRAAVSRRGAPWPSEASRRSSLAGRRACAPGHRYSG